MDQRRNGCLMFSLLVLIVAVKGENLVFNVKHKYGGRNKGSILNDLKAHDSHRHGRMHTSVEFKLGGDGSPTDAAIDDGFPVVTFRFADSLSLTVYPHDYLFQVTESRWCIGWQDSGGMQAKDGMAITLLGDLVLLNKLVLYDVENQTIGWTEFDCSSTIQLKYESSESAGSAYTVASHNISSASTVDSRKAFTFLLIISILYNLLK